MNPPKRRSIHKILNILIFISLFMSGCSHTDRHQITSNQQKTILILVDGLTLSGLQENIAHLPNISRYFLKSRRGGSYVGVATVPSMTFPNIASILTQQPVSKHQIFGNQSLKRRRPISFESVGSQKEFSRLTDDASIFANLKKQNKTSLSLSHYFGRNADETLSLRLDFGFYFLNGEYLKIDSKVLSKLEETLSKPYSKWPDFTFVHLISIDSLSHSFGSASKQTRQGLRLIDRKLGPIFSRLRQVERRRNRPKVLFTSDHGHHEVVNYINIEEALKPFTTDHTLFIDGRFSYVYLNRSWSLERRKAWAKQIDGRSFYSSYAVNLSNGSFLQAGLPAQHLASIQDYFGAKNSPDAIFFAPPKTSYSHEGNSFHGGLSPEEMYVPVLLRNLKISSRHPIQTRTLLNFLFKRTPLPLVTR